MTYLAFHFVFTLPVIAVLGVLHHRRVGRRDPTLNRLRWTGLGLIALIAFAYTTPWDNYLVSEGVWWYGADRVLFVIGHVPIEEYAFFVIQPLMTGLWLFLLIGRDPIPEPGHASSMARYVGCTVYLVAGVLGAYALTQPSMLYLGLILIWACPVLLFQWAFGGHRLWGHRRLWLTAVGVPTLYLWIADRLAIGDGIWYISEEATTGIQLFGLPMEEALFFLVTNLLVVQGLMLFSLVVRSLQYGNGWLGPAEPRLVHAE